MALFNRNKEKQPNNEEQMLRRQSAPKPTAEE